jgi:hypothetical protein
MVLAASLMGLLLLVILGQEPVVLLIGGKEAAEGLNPLQAVEQVEHTGLVAVVALIQLQALMGQPALLLLRSINNESTDSK